VALYCCRAFLPICELSNRALPSRWTQLQDAQRLPVGVAAGSDALLHLLCISLSLFFALSCTFLLLLFVFDPEQSAPLQYWRSPQLRSRRGTSARSVFC